MTTKNIGIFGSCQLHLCDSFFLNEEIQKQFNLKVIFSLPFYEYDPTYQYYKGILDYTIFDNLDFLIIEINNLDNQASSQKIINYCKNKDIKIIKTFLIKFPIYPINWSGFGENNKDYLNWCGLDNINYQEKFNKCIESVRQSNIESDLSTDLTDFICINFNKQLLFTHSLHPTNVLLYQLWKHILIHFSINIDNYKYIFNDELINYWHNPFTSKMLKDLDIKFETVVDDNFYIKRYNTNKHNICENVLIIEHVIPIYFTSKESKRYLHTKKIFKYYNDLRKLLLETHNIKLNFTIIGSNQETSLELFDDYLKNDTFNDNYIEFDQKNITIHSESFFEMLHEKWKVGLTFSVFNKISDIIVMRGSNDLVDPAIYIQMYKQFEKNKDKLYLSSKSIHQLGIYNFSILLESDGNIIEYDNNIQNLNNNCLWDHQYRGDNYPSCFKNSIGTIAFLGMNLNCWKLLLESDFNCYWHEVNLENYIITKLTNLTTVTMNTFFLNIKVNEEITSSSGLIEECNQMNKSISNINELVDNLMMERINDLIYYYNENNISFMIKCVTNIEKMNDFLDKTKFLEHFEYNEDNYMQIKNTHFIENFSGVIFTLP
jgi:hypothetical protein